MLLITYRHDLTATCYILYICVYGLVFDIILIFIEINHIISLKQPHLFIWTYLLSKVQPQGVA